MNVQTGVVGAAPPTDPPGSASPPGDPPEGFGEVLGAQLQKLEGPNTQASTRTARAEGAPAETEADDASSSGTTAEQPGDEAVPVVAANVDHAPEAPETGTPLPAAGPTDPAGLEDRQAGAKALAAAAAMQETAATAVTTAPASAPEPAAPTAGEPIPTKPTAPVTAAPAEPTHPVDPAPESTVPVDDAQASTDPKSATPTVAKPDVVRAGLSAVQTVRAEQSQDVTSPAPGKTDGQPSATEAAVAAVASRRGETAGGQAGTTGDGGQSGRQSGTQQVAAAAVAAQQTAPTDPAAAAAAKAEAPVRAHARLADLADVAGTLIRVAAKDGKTTARITLRPVELGEVEIRLRYHAGGVSADVVAESRQAAQLLTSASGELRRSLESQGLTVHWLDVRAGTEGRRDPDELGTPGGRRRADADSGVEEMDEVTTIEASSLPLAAGAVDVLA